MRQIKKIILLLSIMIVSAMSQKTMATCSLTGSIMQQTYSTYVNLTASVSGGSGHYSYLWSSDVYSSNAYADYLVNNGIYSVTVADSVTGCQIVLSDTVTSLPCNIQASISYVDLGGGLYLFTANATGASHSICIWGLPDWTYPYHNADTISYSCTPGLNHIAVTIQDTIAPYCYYYDSITFVVPSNCTLAVSISTHAYSTYDSLAVDLSGGTPPYLYAWSNSIYQDHIPYVDVSNNGIYSVTVTDANGCSLILSDTVTGLPCSLQPVISYQYLGAGQYHFTATVTGSSHPGYKWNYDNGSIVQMGTGSSFDYTLPAGNCIVALVVRDSLTGCTNFDSIAINVPSGCTLTGAITQQINGGEGNLTASVSGGSGHYQYIWSRTSDSISANVVPVSNNGIYSVTVTDDSTGCQIVLRDTLTTLACNMADSISYVYLGGGVVRFTAHTTGSAHPTYAWDLHPLNYLIGGSDTISHSYPSGWQSVAVTIYDTVSHCVLYDSINFFVPSSVCALTGSITQQTNVGQANLTADISGGSGSYIYTWSHLVYAYGNSFITYNNGIYSVTVTDSTSGCQIVLTDTVTNLPCNVQDSISVQFLGGGQVLLIAHAWGAVNPGYNWTILQGVNTWINPTTDSVVVTMPAGLQSAELWVSSQGSGCSLIDSITFVVPSSCTLAGHIVKQVFSTYDSLTAMVSGGSGQYQFIWSANANSANSTNVIASTNGIYTVTVTDTAGCQIILSDTVTGLSNCTLAVSFHNIYGYNSCGVTATVTGANGPLSGGWSGLISYLLAYNIDSISINNSGTYCFTISDSAGCIVSACDTVDIPACHLTGSLAAISVTAGSDTFEAHVNNGTPPYTYEWASIWGLVSTGSSPVYGIGPPQGVCVKVTDSIGCVIDMCDSPTVSPLGVSDIQDHPVITVQPNPFRDYTTITVSGVDIMDARLEIYTIVGQRVAVSAPAPDGVFHLDRAGLSGGIYIYRIRQGDRSIGSGKLVIEQ